MNPRKEKSEARLLLPTVLVSVIISTAAAQAATTANDQGDRLDARIGRIQTLFRTSAVHMPAENEPRTVQFPFQNFPNYFPNFPNFPNYFPNFPNFRNF